MPDSKAKEDVTASLRAKVGKQLEREFTTARTLGFAEALLVLVVKSDYYAAESNMRMARAAVETILFCGGLKP